MSNAFVIKVDFADALGRLPMYVSEVRRHDLPDAEDGWHLSEEPGLAVIFDWEGMRDTLARLRRDLAARYGAPPNRSMRHPVPIAYPRPVY